MKKGKIYFVIKYVGCFDQFVFGYRISQKELNIRLRFPEGLESFAGLPLMDLALCLIHILLFGSDMYFR